jgi:glucokinase
MNTLAIDIGGTKFTVALFQDERMSRRESRPTNRECGPEWMTSQIGSIALGWRKDPGFERCAIGFGGPVDFARQRTRLRYRIRLLKRKTNDWSP